MKKIVSYLELSENQKQQAQNFKENKKMSKKEASKHHWQLKDGKVIGQVVGWKPKRSS